MVKQQEKQQKDVVLRRCKISSVITVRLQAKRAHHYLYIWTYFVSVIALVEFAKHDNASNPTVENTCSLVVYVVILKLRSVCSYCKVYSIYEITTESLITIIICSLNLPTSRNRPPPVLVPLLPILQ